MSRLAEGERANAELLAYLILGAAARKGGESLLRPKVHFFLRGLDEMVVALDGTEADAQDPPVPVAPRRQGAVRRPARRRLLPRADLPELRPALLREARTQDLELARGAKNQLRGFENGNAAQDDDRAGQRLSGPPTPAGTGTRLVLTNRLLEEADGGPTARVSQVAEGLVLPPVRGHAP